MKNNNFSINLAAKGMAMGMAEVVPGVSGGTIAFITGIYEQLIDCIKSIDGAFLKELVTLKWKSAFSRIDGWFLLNVLVGMFIGIIIATFTVTYLLDKYPPIIWSFFFGLIIASVVYMVRQWESYRISDWVLFGIAAIFAFAIVQLTPGMGSTAYWFVFLSGMIAFCALILPGISGSFMLLLMGMYTTIIPTLKLFLSTFELQYFLLLAVFGLGGLVGLASFSRILSYTFKHYKDSTLAVLSGFMLGSLWKIWPWRNVLSWMDDEGTRFSSELTTFPLAAADDFKILLEKNVLPSMYDSNPYVIYSIIALIIGISLVFIFDRK